MTGTVKFFNDARGFGFIKPADGSPDVFVHVSAIRPLSTLQDGQQVQYVAEYNFKGPCALSVRVLG
jgi:CspA family cold shock protein